MTQQIEHIDKAVNILMDEIMRPYLGITDAVDNDLDDEVYSFVHSHVKAVVMNAYFEFQSARNDKSRTY